jgi:hypothetical protein
VYFPVREAALPKRAAKKGVPMLNFRSRHLVLFSLSFVVVCAFTGAAEAQKKPAKKPVAAKNGQPAPKLKPAITGKNKTSAKKAAKETAKEGPAAQTDAVKSETAKNPAVSPNPPVKKDAKEKIDTTLADTEKGAGHDTHANTDSPHESVKENAKPIATRLEVKEKAKEATKENAEAKVRAKKVVVKKSAAKTKASETTAEAKPKSEAKKKETVTVAAKSRKEPEPKKAAPRENIALKEPVKEPTKAPTKTWLPPVTADKIRTDINGKTIADVPSEYNGDGVMDWQFASNQPKEVEIIGMKNGEDERTIDVLLTARNARPNLDGAFERVSGKARLHYERGANKWELLYVENVSLKHGDIDVAEKPARKADDSAMVVPAPQPQPPIAPVALVPGHNVNVSAGQYSSYSFNVTRPTIVSGRFLARGGAQNDIETYILDENGFLNWTNNHGSAAYYNSGRLTAANIDTVVGPGTYFLVFNNRYAPDDGKTVEANIELRPEQTAYAGNSAGTGGTINTITRSYLPSADPVQPYKKAETVAAVKKPVTAQPPIQPTSQPKISEVAGYADEIVLTNQFQVAGGNQYAVQFSVNPGGVVRGTFDVVGGGIDPLIETYIMTAAQYQRWSASREGVLDYSSGRVTGGRIERALTQGDYYLVFCNRNSRWDAKTVRANIQVEYLHR